MTELTGSEHGDLLRDMSERASTLYWHSSRSVNSIADDLGLSKGRLYDLIRPLASGRDCPNCQSELVFTNRTAKERDAAICPVCDAEGVTIEAMGSVASSGADGHATTQGSRAATNGVAAASADADLDTPPPLSGETKGLMAGLLVGTFTGILLGRYFLR